jgi:hypothetical protein
MKEANGMKILNSSQDRKGPRFTSYLFTVAALLFVPAMTWADLSLEQVKAISHRLKLHSSTIFGFDRWLDTSHGQWTQDPELKELRQQFLKNFNFDDGARFTDRARMGSTAAKNVYEAGALRGIDRKFYRAWNSEGVDPRSNYFIFGKHNTYRELGLLAPLRVDNDLLIFLGSVGPTRIGNGVVYPDTEHGLSGSKLVLGIGIPLDSIDQPDHLPTADSIRYQLRMDGMTGEEMNARYKQELEKYPHFDLMANSMSGPGVDPRDFLGADSMGDAMGEVDDASRSKIKTSINEAFGNARGDLRLKLNIANRDLHAEAMELISKAATSIPELNSNQHRLRIDGTGFIKRRDGRQYMIQTVFLRGDDATSDHYVQFIKNLLNPKLRVTKRILPPLSPEKAEKTLGKLKERRSAKDAQAIVNRLRGVDESQESAARVTADVLSKFRNPSNRTPPSGRVVLHQNENPIVENVTPEPKIASQPPAGENVVSNYPPQPKHAKATVPHTQPQSELTRQVVAPAKELRFNVRLGDLEKVDQRLFKEAMSLAKAAAPRGVSLKASREGSVDFEIEVIDSSKVGKELARLRSDGALVVSTHDMAYSFVSRDRANGPYQVRLVWDKLKKGPRSWRKADPAADLAEIVRALTREIYGNVQSFGNVQQFLTNQTTEHSQKANDLALVALKRDAYRAGSEGLQKLIEISESNPRFSMLKREALRAAYSKENFEFNNWNTTAKDLGIQDHERLVDSTCLLQGMLKLFR